VHRLGRFTCGLLVCARRGATRAWLSAALRDSTRAGAPGDDAQASLPARGARVRKLYRALLEPGRLRLELGDALAITTPIGRRPHPRLGAIWCAGEVGVAGDLACRSSLTLLERRAVAVLVAVAIGSGRPHQIRIHCASVGAPLLGDPLYRPGGQADPEALPGEGGYHLQAWRLELRRPEGEPLVLEAPKALGFEALQAGP
jgi:23S rRNA pseudouridine1911/1915/1917 synthase